MPRSDKPGTRVYGYSDDNVAFEGELDGEFGCYGSGDDDNDRSIGILVAFSDGTVLAIKYGKPGLGGVWALTPLVQGALFDRIDICNDEDADPYSDVVHFKPGKLKAWAAGEAERVH
jgi:hypothetical protein